MSAARCRWGGGYSAGRRPARAAGGAAGGPHGRGLGRVAGKSLRLGYAGASNSGPTVDGWYRDGPTDARFDLDSACERQNPSYVSGGYAVAAAYADYGAWNRIGCVATA